MVFFRCCFSTVLLLCIQAVHGQTVYYPADASSLLKSTAADIASLFTKSINGSHFSTQPYTTVPGEGIVLMYDQSPEGNQSCKVQSNGSSFIQFSAAEDNGINYGVYQYIGQLGFRFYQPGIIWEIIPALSSPFKKIDTVYACRYKYKNWFISGGHNTWIMDKENQYPWDSYFGENGHAWSLYQRRNNMLGAHRFTGHRDDIMTPDYIATLKANPCYVAPYNGSREATVQSVPDINNAAAMQLWSSSIQKKYSQFSTNIFSNKSIYANIYRNYSHDYNCIGIEVPDGSHWANSTDATCGNSKLVNESEQHFTLANYVSSAIAAKLPGRQFQVYAYDGHADLPSAAVSINDNIDIQVVPVAYQSVTTAKGLMKRWYERSPNISEYHYLNLGQWSGETPSFLLNDFKNTIQRIKDKNSQGIVIEASPAKFASLPFLLAFNNCLKDNTDIETTLLSFCNDMFGNAAASIYQLLHLWADDKTLMLNNGLQDNKYKMPLYYHLLKKADGETRDAPALIKERINELKVYLHYMSLHYDWIFDQRPVEMKENKAAALCLYLARINKLKIVNSYFLISNIVNRYSSESIFFSTYNVHSGTAYQHGALPLLSAADLENNFAADLSQQLDIAGQCKFETATTIKSAFAEGGIRPADKIKLFMNYTHGKDYATKSEFYIDADKAGDFSIGYTPVFNMAGKGSINFIVEYADKPLGIIADVTSTTAGNALLKVSLPGRGTYKLSILTKFQTAVHLEINTNGNYFYKNGPYLGNTIENYRNDLQSLPGYFYIPAGIDKVYFSLNNSNPSGRGFATPEEVSNIFIFKDSKGYRAEPRLVTPADSALFYLEVPTGTSGSFWQAGKMEQYQLTFVNISNIQWYAVRKPCSNVGFKAEIVQQNKKCITLLSTAPGSTGVQWKIEAAGNIVYYKQDTVLLSEDISPNTMVTVWADNICSTARRLASNAMYIEQKSRCASGGAVAPPSVKIAVYPNPGAGIFYCQQNGNPVVPQSIIITNSAGCRQAQFFNTGQFNITHLPAGIYFYQLLIKNEWFTGRLIRR